MAFGIPQVVRSAEDQMEKAGVMESIALMMVNFSYGMISIVKNPHQQFSPQPCLKGVTMKVNGTHKESLKELMYVDVDMEHSVV